MQEPSAYEIADRPLYGVAALEAAEMGIEHLGDLRDRELNWMLSKKEGQDDSLVLGILGSAAGRIGRAAIRRPGTGHRSYAPPCLRWTVMKLPWI